MLGLSYEYYLLHPEYFIFVYEVLNKLNRNDNHNIESAKFTEGMNKDYAGTKHDRNSYRLTVLPFTYVKVVAMLT